MTALRFEIFTGEIRETARLYPDVAREEIRATLALIAARMETEVAVRTPVGVGGEAGYRGSLFGEVQEFGARLRGVWGSPLPYGEVLEKGRTPGKKMPPPGPLALWAMRKLGVPEDEAEEVGWLIARKIAIHGTEGAKMFERAWNANRTWVMAQLNQIPGRILRRLDRGTA